MSIYTKGVKQMKNQKEREMLCKMQKTYTSLFAVVNKLQACADVSTGGLTSRQYLLLTTISKMVPEEATLNNIANKMATSKQNINKLVTTLEHKEYVSIVSSKTDRRAVNVSVTEKGKKAIDQSSVAIHQFYADVFKSFPEHEIDELQRLLNKLATFDGVPLFTASNDTEEPVAIESKEFDDFLRDFSKIRKKIGK